MPKELGGLGALRDLNLAQNQLRGELRPSLGLTLTSLQTLNLSNNALSGTVMNTHTSRGFAPLLCFGCSSACHFSIFVPGIKTNKKSNLTKHLLLPAFFLLPPPPLHA